MLSSSANGVDEPSLRHYETVIPAVMKAWTTGVLLGFRLILGECLVISFICGSCSAFTSVVDWRLCGRGFKPRQLNLDVLLRSARVGTIV